MKRFRDEQGRLTLPLQEVAQLTRAEATEYYQSGAEYIRAGHRYTCTRWTDDRAGECIRFDRIDGEDHIYCCPEMMGTFLPDVASEGLEIVRAEA